MSEYRLSELHLFIRRFVALNLPNAVWVQAEITEVDERRGHYYLSLIEKAEDSEQVLAQGQAMMWERQAKKWQREHQLLLRNILQAGREVKIQVQVEFHERYGLSMYIVDIDPQFTLGLLAQQRQATLDYLESKQLLGANSQLHLPLAPQRLAIISSPAAAGLQDFLAQLTDNSYGYQFQTQLFPAAVQGAQTSPEVRRQLRAIQRRADYYDAIVIIRGGGAKMDLADFDERELCLQAAQCSLPIITGIGHQTDQSILDLLAYRSLKTPTAAANFFIDRLLHFEQRLGVVARQLQLLERHHLRTAENQLQYFRTSLHLREQQLLQQHRLQLKMISQQLPLLLQQRLREAKRKLEEITKLHEVLSLEGHLKRGFSVLTQEDRIINSIEDLQTGQAIKAKLKDGQLELEIKSTPKK